MFKRITRAFWHFGYVASFFADVPPFLTWLYHQGQWIASLMIQEPIGSLALLLALVVTVAVAWLAMKIQPPIL
jgi:hypothetical protein